MKVKLKSHPELPGMAFKIIWSYFLSFELASLMWKPQGYFRREPFFVEDKKQRPTE